jgi:hypothetical protein
MGSAEAVEAGWRDVRRRPHQQGGSHRIAGQGRDRKFEDGPYKGCQKNELTDDGAKLAAVCIELDEMYGAAN